MAPSPQGYLFGNSSHNLASLRSALTHEINAQEVEGRQNSAIIEQWKSAAAALEYPLILKTGKNEALQADVATYASRFMLWNPAHITGPQKPQTQGKNAKNCLPKQQIEGLKAKRWQWEDTTTERGRSVENCHMQQPIQVTLNEERKKDEWIVKNLGTHIEQERAEKEEWKKEEARPRGAVVWLSEI